MVSSEEVLDASNLRPMSSKFVRSVSLDEEECEVGCEGEIFPRILRGSYSALRANSGEQAWSPPTSLQAPTTTTSSETDSSRFRVWFLCAEPLVYRQLDGSYAPLPRVQRRRGGELDTVRSVLASGAAASSGVQVELRSATATLATFQTCLTIGADVLHLVCHGRPDCLIFEVESRAELDPVPMPRLREVVRAGLRGAEAMQLRLVFASACRSEFAGRAFASAGVPHVVCTPVNAKISDAQSRAFCSQFYVAVLAGRTVRHAFEIGLAAIGSENSRAYLLLPESGDHDVALVESEQLLVVQRPAILLYDKAPDAVNDCPAPPEPFVGRALHMAELVNYLDFQDQHLVTIRGDAGVGKSALAHAAVQHMLDRSAFAAAAYVDLSSTTSRTMLCRAFLNAANRLCSRMLVENLQPPNLTRRITSHSDDDDAGLDDVEAAYEAVVAAAKASADPERYRKGVRVIVVVDDADPKVHSKGLVQLLSRLLSSPPGRSLAILCTSQSALHAPGSIDRVATQPEKICHLMPLEDRDIARLLLRFAPRTIPLSELSSSPMPLTKKPLAHAIATSLASRCQADPALQLAGGTELHASSVMANSLTALAKEPFVRELGGNPQAAYIFAPYLQERHLTKDAALLTRDARDAAHKVFDLPTKNEDCDEPQYPALVEAAHTLANAFLGPKDHGFSGSA